MNSTRSRFPLATTAASATIATLAAVGIVFLVPAPAFRNFSVITIPATALLITTLLLALEKNLLARGAERGREAAQLDPLTGLPSEPVAERALAAEFAAAERGRPLAIAMFRIDEFRRFGARHGTEAADRLLMFAGRVFQRRTRGMNLSYRFDDSGTFVSIVSGQTLAGARTFAARVRKDLMALEVANQPQSVTVGIATFDPGMHSPLQLLVAAEKALLEASADEDDIRVHGEVDVPIAVIQ